MTETQDELGVKFSESKMGAEGKKITELLPYESPPQQPLPEIGKVMARLDGMARPADEIQRKKQKAAIRIYEKVMGKQVQEGLKRDLGEGINPFSEGLRNVMLEQRGNIALETSFAVQVEDLEIPAGRETVSDEEKLVDQAAAVIGGFVNLRKAYWEGKMEQRKTKVNDKEVWMDMSGMQEAMSGSVRLPKLIRDEVVKHPDSKHIVVVTEGTPYVLENALEASPEDIRDAVQLIVASKKEQPPGPAVGALSMQNRGIWEIHRRQLVRDPHNAEVMKLMDEAALVVSIDGKMDLTDEGAGMKNIQIGTEKSRGNRWADKMNAVIMQGVDGQGKWGVLFEHVQTNGSEGAEMIESWREAANILLRQEFRSNGEKIDEQAALEVKRMSWKVDQPIQEEINMAAGRLEKEEMGLLMETRTIKGLGKDELKFLLKDDKNREKVLIKADTAVQIAIQMALAAVGEPTDTTEPVNLRNFEGGPIEMCGVGTDEVRRLVNLCSGLMKAGMSGEGLRLEKEAKDKLQGAITAAAVRHQENIKQAKSGETTVLHLIATSDQLSQLTGIPISAQRDGFNLLCPQFKEIFSATNQASNFSVKGIFAASTQPEPGGKNGIGYVIKEGAITVNLKCPDSEKEKMGKFLDALEVGLELVREICRDDGEKPVQEEGVGEPKEQKQVPAMEMLIILVLLSILVVVRWMI